MALVLADRVKDTTTTTGTGTITLSGTAPIGYVSFGTAIGNGNTTYYTITAGSEWEVGIGTYTASGTTLSRDTVLASSAGGTTKVTFSAGTKDVFVTYPAGKAISDGYGTLPAANGGTGLTSPGTSGNVLTSNGTAWTSAAAGWTQISSAAFVNTGTTFSSIPTTYSDLLVVLYDVLNNAGGSSAIWAYLGTASTFQTTPVKLITLYSDGSYAYATVLLPNYKADRGGIFINSGIELSAVLASPATATGNATVDDAGTWRVTGGINRIKVSTDGASSSGGTVVLYGK
jgi:hypothetical protein